MKLYFVTGAQAPKADTHRILAGGHVAPCAFRYVKTARATGAVLWAAEYADTVRGARLQVRENVKYWRDVA